MVYASSFIGLAAKFLLRKPNGNLRKLDPLRVRPYPTGILSPHFAVRSVSSA